MKCSLAISFLLKRSLVFPILLFPSISLHCSLRKLSYVSLLFFETLYSDGYILLLLCLLLLFFSQLYVRRPQTIALPFCISFSWGWIWSRPSVQCYKPLSIVSQALYHIKSLESIGHLHCIFIRDLIQIIPEWSSGFLYFLQFKSAVTIHSDFETQEKKVCHFFNLKPICLPWNDGTGCHDLSFMNVVF